MTSDERIDLGNRQRDLDEAQQTIEDYTCGECDSHLKVEFQADGGVRPACRMNTRHAGYKMIETPMELADQSASIARIQESQEMRSPLVRQENTIAVIGEVAMKYQLSTNEANVFYAHFIRLGLDTFLGQIIPLVYKSKHDARRRTVIPFITKKGWSALASRSEPKEFLGPPTLYPVKDEDKAQWGYGAGDVVYEAKGRKRSWPDGYEGGQIIAAFTVDEIGKAREYGQVSGTDTHQHCRVRAVRRWYEENYPDAAALVSVATAELPAEVIDVIEGEYRVLEEGEASQQRQISTGSQPRSQPKGSSDDAISDSQMTYILRMINDAWGWTEDDLVREMLDDAPLDSLDKKTASELIDRLKENIAGSSPRQGAFSG